MATGSYSYPPYGLPGSSVESLGSNAGFVFIKEQTMTAAATTQVTDVFSRDYQDYLVLFNCTSSAVNQYQIISFLQNSTVQGAGTYINAGMWFYYNSGVTGSWASTSADGCICGYTAAPSTTNPTVGQIIIRNPFVSNVDTTTEQLFDMGGSFLGWGASRYPTSKVINGFQITQQSGGNLTGLVSVYGMRRS
jgi:hypothetical protein